MHETRAARRPLPYRYRTVTVPLPYRYRTVTVPLPYRTPPRQSSSQKPSFGRIKMRVRAARVCAKACRRAAAHGRSAVVILKAAKHKQETTLTVPKLSPSRCTAARRSSRRHASTTTDPSCLAPAGPHAASPRRAAPSTRSGRRPAQRPPPCGRARSAQGRDGARRPARTRRLGQGWQRDQRDSEAVAALVPPVLGRNKKGGALITGRMRDQANRTRAACQLVGALSVHRRARPFSTGT